MAKSALGRGLGDLMEATSKSSHLPTAAPNEETGKLRLDQGFQTILEKPVPEAKSGDRSARVSATIPQTSTSVRKHDLAARFAVQALVVQDILLLAATVLMAATQTQRFGWVEIIVCSVLVAVGAGCSILAVWLAREKHPFPFPPENQKTASNAPLRTSSDPHRLGPPVPPR